MPRARYARVPVPADVRRRVGDLVVALGTRNVRVALETSDAVIADAVTPGSNMRVETLARLVDAIEKEEKRHGCATESRHDGDG